MSGLVWIMMFFGFMFAMIISVPRQAILRLLPIGLFGGFGQSIILLGLVVPVLGIWRFNYTNIFSVAGFPVFVSLSWIPVVIIYTYYLNLLHNRRWLYIYIAASSLATWIFVHWLYRAHLIIFRNWHTLYTFGVAAVLFSIVTYFFLHIQREKPLLSKED